jgi:hypothetical protein
MTSQGTAHGRFTRAIKRGHLLAAETAARELGSLSLSDALSLVLLYEREGDEKFERAARRWVRRVQIDYSLRHREVELLRAAMGALGSRFGRIALAALLETCPELRVGCTNSAEHDETPDLQAGPSLRTTGWLGRVSCLFRVGEGCLDHGGKLGCSAVRRCGRGRGSPLSTGGALGDASEGRSAHPARRPARVLARVGMPCAIGGQQCDRDPAFEQRQRSARPRGFGGARGVLASSTPRGAGRCGLALVKGVRKPAQRGA